MPYCRERCHEFSFSHDFEQRFLQQNNAKVCVVSIVGKSSLHAHHSKASIINPLVDTALFMGKTQRKTAATADLMDVKCHIEGFYDAEKNVIYLHLTSAFDTAALSVMCEKAGTENLCEMWRYAESSHARALLFLFSVSHILLFVHPGTSFDVSYVRLFRILESIRQKIQPEVTDLLRGLPLSPDWICAARPCSPRALFLFHSHVFAEHSVLRSTDSNQHSLPMKKLQHAIEDQIYRILRKARVITNISNNSLFAVPVNQEFVYIHDTSETRDPVQFYLAQLTDHCRLDSSSAERSRSHAYSVNRNSTHVSHAEGGDSAPQSDVNGFKKLLCQHIELAQTKGFDDNMRKNVTPSVFELPTCTSWFEACNVLYKFFMNSVDHPHFNTLQSLLDIDIRFSESRCAKVLPLAANAYQEKLPQHYTRSVHLSKLEQARRVFLQHARGPVCDKYLDQLAADCEKIWCNGRQLCEAVSLTGRHCVNQLHNLPNEDIKKLSGEVKSSGVPSLPTMPHCSQTKTKAACNCGRKQAEHDDPFDHKAANYEFFESLAAQCCDSLEHFNFPIFAAADGVDATCTPEPCSADVDVDKDAAAAALKADQTELSLALSLSQSVRPDLYGLQESCAGEETVHDSNAADKSLAVGSKCLLGMMHVNSPVGKLPKFPSWSLVMLGKYSSYSHSQGLDQPGFLHGSSYLLPWDVCTRHDKPDKWPSVNESKKCKSRKAVKELTELTLRLYFGLEYECPRGHRFFLSSPDKILKCPVAMTSLGLPKEYNAHKVMTNDMPLYFSCHCRSSKGFVAQLMRIFVALPEHIAVELNVRVQPAPPSGPIFHPEIEGGKLLLSTPGLWVLRLPCVYVGESAAYLPPSDPQLLTGCHVMKGIFTICENVPTT